MIQKHACRTALALFALLLLAFPVRAQTTYGSIVGTARDTTDAVVVGVQVKVTNEATGVIVVQATNQSGNYSFTTLFPGHYRIHAESPGFRPVDVGGIQLEVNQSVRYDLAMQVGQLSERVEVTAGLAALATETSDVGQVVGNQQVVDLPLNGWTGVLATGSPHQRRFPDRR
jgi:hypothetical protein